MGRLALVAPTCLPAAASLSIYTILSRYTLTMLRALTLRRRPAVTLSPARTPLEQRPLSPDVIAPLPWPAADQVVAACIASSGAVMRTIYPLSCREVVDE